MPERLCSVEGCQLIHYAKGFCKNHYARAFPRARKQRPKCAFEDCVNGRNGTTYCKAHEDQIKAGKEPQPLQARRRIVDGMKECSDCGRILPVSAYNKHATGIHPKCRECYNIANRFVRYGITRGEVLDLLARPCDSCGEDVDRHRKHVDHDHATGKVRGVLCHNCNLVLGLVHDDPGTLRALTTYIERHR